MKTSLLDVISTCRVTCAKALAEGFVVGIDNAHNNGRPLTQVQQSDILESMMLALEPAIQDFASVLGLSEDLKNARI